MYQEASSRGGASFPRGLSPFWNDRFSHNCLKLTLCRCPTEAVHQPISTHVLDQSAKLTFFVASFSKCLLVEPSSSFTYWRLQIRLPLRCFTYNFLSLELVVTCDRLLLLFFNFDILDRPISIGALAQQTRTYLSRRLCRCRCHSTFFSFFTLLGLPAPHRMLLAYGNNDLLGFAQVGSIVFNLIIQSPDFGLQFPHLRICLRYWSHFGPYLNFWRGWLCPCFHSFYKYYVAELLK